MNAARHKGLGRGLDALLADDGDGARPGDRQTTLALGQLERGRYQPRSRMDEESLRELAASIGKQGLMQPILVRPTGRERYEIIAGERRWRAARLAGLAEVPVIVREVPDSSALAMALIENIQREDLNPIEEASGVQRLIQEFHLTHQEAAEAIGRSRAATTNLLRLLNLAPPVQQMLLDGRIEMGHARTLLPLDPPAQEELAQRIERDGLSVRTAEQLVQSLLHPAARVKRRARADRDVARLEEELSGEIGTTVQIKPGKKGTGKLVLHYSSHEHLDGLLTRLKAS